MAPRITNPANRSDGNGATSSQESSGRRTHAARRVNAALLCLLIAAGVCQAAPRDPRKVVLRQAEKRGPAVAGEVNLKVTIKLQAGYRTALRKVHRIEACRDLFAALGADGLEVLGNTTYTLAEADWEKRVCGGAEAFTEVGGSRVWLCGGFGWISEKDAALILIHEALHNAGLTEQPHDPDGPTPDEIDRTVATHCGF